MRGEGEGRRRGATSPTQRQESGRGGIIPTGAKQATAGLSEGYRGAGEERAQERGSRREREQERRGSRKRMSTRSPEICVLRGG